MGKRRAPSCEDEGTSTDLEVGPLSSRFVFFTHAGKGAGEWNPLSEHSRMLPSGTLQEAPPVVLFGVGKSIDRSFYIGGCISLLHFPIQRWHAAQRVNDS